MWQEQRGTQQWQKLRFAQLPAGYTERLDTYKGMQYTTYNS